MNTYKVIFTDNNVISCTKIRENNHLLNSYQYETEQQRLTAALIEAETVEKAQQLAKNIIREFNIKLFGSDLLHSS